MVVYKQISNNGSNTTNKSFLFQWVYRMVMLVVCVILLIYLIMPSKYMEYFVNASMSGLSNFSSKLQTSNNALANGSKPEISQNKRISNELVEFDVHFKDFQTKLLFSKPEQDCVEGTNALIFVPSTMDSVNLRNEIRTNDSASKLPGDMRLYFLVTLNEYPANRDELKEKLGEEQTKFADIILTDIMDSYANSSLKTYAMFAWKEMFCKSAKFLVKNEKESVILPERLGYWIERNFSKMGMAEDGTMVDLSEQPEASRKFIVGHPNANFAVVRDQKSQWYVSKEQYPNDSYPSYVNSFCYLLSAPAVTAIMEKTSEQQMIQIEDALFTGILAEQAGVARIDGRWHVRNNGQILFAEPCDETDNNGAKVAPKLFAINLNGNGDKIKIAYDFLRKMKCESGPMIIVKNEQYSLK